MATTERGDIQFVIEIVMSHAGTENEVPARNRRALTFTQQEKAAEEIKLSTFADLLQCLWEEKPEQFVRHVLHMEPGHFAKRGLSTNAIWEAIAKYHNNLCETHGDPPVVELSEDNELLLHIDHRLDPSEAIRSKFHEAGLHRPTVEEREERVKLLESLVVEEDKFGLCEDQIKSLRISENDVHKPPYHSPQLFLAENLLDRIAIIMGKGQPLEEKFDSFEFQIYTAGADMLEQQTEDRLMNPAAECFSERITSSEADLRRSAKKSVNKYKICEGVEERYQELLLKVQQNPKTLFLIVADEAHWGPTNESSNVTKENEEGCVRRKAYNSLINSWSDKEHSNVIILQVTATPYNLMTENTRLVLDQVCVWETSEEKRVLRVVPSTEACTRKTVKLHHMKWDETFESLVQVGVKVVVKIPRKSKVGSNSFLAAADDGILRLSDSETELLMRGDSAEKVRIQTIDGRTLVVAADNTKGTRSRKSQRVLFVTPDELREGTNFLTTFKISLCGQDVFLLETSDSGYKLRFDEDTKMVVAETIRRATVEVPYMEGSFVMWSTQPAGNLQEVEEYVSLNFLFNSMGEEHISDQYLRGDEDFDTLCEEMKKKSFDRYDILTADYAIHLLHINKIRECELQVKDLEQVLEAMDEACGQYTTERDMLIGRFMEELGTGGRKVPTIHPDLFEAVLSVIENRTKALLITELKRLKDGNPNACAADACSYIVGCLLFLRRKALCELRQNQQVQHLIDGKKTYKDVFLEFKAIDFEEQKQNRVSETETCRLIEDLVIEDISKELEGPMKIVRMTVESGNRMYASLCLARKLSSGQNYSFEILRDYDSFHISDIQDNTDVATYRIRKILQRRTCDFVFRDGHRCPCSAYEATTTLHCTKCHHLHTKVENYVDLNRLPCLIIMVGKGRMGDTFPENFNAMDLRASTQPKRDPILTTLAQELGRLCRYVKKSTGNIPYALLGKGLAEKLDSRRQQYASYYAGFGKKDPYMLCGNKPGIRHFDFNNKGKHRNRILFEAEPQIGKTGVYLCLISLLRKLIEEEKDEEKEEIVEEIGRDEEAAEAICPVQCSAQFEEDWRWSYWKDVNKEPPVLSTKIDAGKYVSIFGPYIFGDSPERILNRRNEIGKSRTGVIKNRKPGNLKFRTFPKQPSHALCKRHSLGGKGIPYQIKVSGTEVLMSVPTLCRFQPLLETLGLDYVNSGVGVFSEKKETLKTWIFTPSSGRSRKAYLNFDYTMVDNNGNPVQYVHVIVVRSNEYEAYFREWGSTHAVVRLPHSLPEAEGIDPEEGGVGYARLFIQLMAAEFNLPAVFMLDDNILSCSEVQFLHNSSKYEVLRENGNLQYESVPLFACLHHLETQLYGAGNPPPKENFVAFPNQGSSADTQESFTGPWSQYGIIGMLRQSQFVYRYRVPFTRSHVMAAVLVNIRALSAKQLLYKPWPVSNQMFCSSLPEY